MQNANVKSLKRFIFALRKFDWQLTRLFARNTPEKQLSTKFHSQMYFAFQVRFRDARIRKDLLEIFWYSIFVSSRKVLRNSRFEKLIRVESSNRSSSNVESWERKKKKKKKNSFRSFQRSALRQISFRFPGNVFSVESFAKRDSYGSSKPTTDGFAFGDLPAATHLISDPHDLSICYRIRSPLF